MSVRGPLDHVDLTVADPARSIPFYAALLEALGYRRLHPDAPSFRGPEAQRGLWELRYSDGPAFSIEVRPARGERRDRPVDRYAPGLHHMAFHAESRAAVDAIHDAVRAAGGTVLDPPFDYSGRPGYEEGYYAVFFADPDGIKLEVLHLPRSNP